ncbi:MAG: hypothetical protein J6N81_06285 [Treponema sp.]|nr:hypothetical protein [Treponema sp.]
MSYSICAYCGKKHEFSSGIHDWESDADFCCKGHMELYRKAKNDNSGSSEGGSSSGGSSGGGISVGSGLGKLLGGLIKGAGSITKEIGSMCKEALDDEKAATQASKAEAESIKNMVIPSEQTELIEFMTNAVSKYNPKVKDYQTDEKRVNEAWAEKIREAHSKLKLTLPADSPELQKFDNITAELQIYGKPSKLDKVFGKISQAGGSVNIVQKNNFLDTLMENSGPGIIKKVEAVANLQFETTSDGIQQQLNNLFTQISGISRFQMKPLYNAIKEKIEFGIMKLNSMGANAEADFFQKKFDKLK